MKIEVDKEEVTMVSNEMRKANIKEVETEKTKHVGTEYSEELKREMKVENTVGMSPTGSSAAEREAEGEVEVSKSATIKYCFIPSTSFNDLEDESGLETGSVLTEKVKLILTDLP